MSDRLVRIHEVKRLTGWSTATIYRKEKAGLFPRRRRLGPNSTRWLMSELQEFLRTREVVIVGSGEAKPHSANPVSR